MAICAGLILTDAEIRKIIDSPVVLRGFQMPEREPGEIYPFGDSVVFPLEPYDDGSGAVICRVRFGR